MKNTIKKIREFLHYVFVEYYLIEKQKIVQNELKQSYFLKINPDRSFEWTENPQQATGINFLAASISRAALVKQEKYGYTYSLVTVGDALFIHEIMHGKISPPEAIYSSPNQLTSKTKTNEQNPECQDSGQAHRTGSSN